MLHPHDPANYPTPDQERMHEMQGEIDYLSEQLRDSYGLIRELENCDKLPSAAYFPLQERVRQWLDQNAALAKAEAVSKETQ